MPCLIAEHLGNPCQGLVAGLLKHPERLQRMIVKRRKGLPQSLDRRQEISLRCAHQSAYHLQAYHFLVSRFGYLLAGWWHYLAKIPPARTDQVCPELAGTCRNRIEDLPGLVGSGELVSHLSALEFRIWDLQRYHSHNSKGARCQ